MTTASRSPSESAGALALGLVLGAVACGDDGGGFADSGFTTGHGSGAVSITEPSAGPTTLTTTVDPTRDTEVGEYGHALDIQPIWSASCVTGCHEPGGTNADLNLRDDAYTQLTQGASVQSTLAWVVPGDLQQSYLWHKVRGTQSDVGGAGARMPVAEDPLDDATLVIIEDWILGGAMP